MFDAHRPSDLDLGDVAGVAQFSPAHFREHALGSRSRTDLRFQRHLDAQFAELFTHHSALSPQAPRGACRTGCQRSQLDSKVSIVTSAQAAALGLGRIAGLEKHIRQYRNGRDLTQTSREAMVIDLFGLGVEEVRTRFSAVYQHLLEQVKPERDQNNCAGRRKKWWLFGEALSTFRPALEGLQRYIATVETAKHRVFQFLSTDILPDNMLVNIALEDGYSLGILSSRVHVVWALAAGGRLGVGNDPRHNKSRGFEPFPFPMPIEQQRKGISELAEQIDAHRKRQLALHPSLTLTEMYNTLETLRAGRVLTDKEKQIHTLGLVSTLLELHQKLDALVLLTYGWAGTLSDADTLEKLVALNLERQRDGALPAPRVPKPQHRHARHRPRTAR